MRASPQAKWALVISVTSSVKRRSALKVLNDGSQITGSTLIVGDAQRFGAT
jgi:hypothetical protein